MTVSNKKRIIIIWTLVSLFMLLHFFLLLSVGVIATDLRQDLRITALSLSFLSSSYLYIYFILQIPAGILLDEFGARSLLGGGGLLSGVACAVFAYSDNFYLSVLARILTGAGLAFVFVASIQLAHRWFAPRYFSMMIGFVEAAAMAGAVIGSLLLAVFMQSLGWRFSFGLAAGAGLVLGVVAWIFIRDYPYGYPISKRSKLTFTKVWNNVKSLVKKREIWIQSSYVALMDITITVFCGLWANPFLRKAFGLSLEKSTIACSLLLVGIGIGSPIAGVLCDTRVKRITFMRWCAVASLVFTCVILYVPNLSYALINITMFMIGLAGSSLILAFAIVSDMAPEGAKSASVGLTNTISFSSAIIFQPVVGWVLHMLSDQRTITGLDYYSALNYRYALSIMPVLLIAALVVSMYMRPDHA